MTSPSGSFRLAPESADLQDIPAAGTEEHSTVNSIPPIRWIVVGYFFWVGIFLGALIMHAATSY